MRTVGINCEVLVDDLTANWIEELIKSGNLPSDLAFYFLQRRSGGRVIRDDELDVIVDNILATMETSSVQQDTIEEAVKNAMMDLLASGSLNLGSNVDLRAAENKSNSDADDSESPEEYMSQVVTFASDPTGEDGEAEEMSEEDADDLADFFGF